MNVAAVGKLLAYFGPDLAEAFPEGKDAADRVVPVSDLMGIGGHGNQRAVLENDPKAQESADAVVGRGEGAPLDGAPEEWKDIRTRSAWGLCRTRTN